MKTTQIITVAVVAILVVAVGAFIILNNSGDDDAEPTGGLYDLNAKVINVEMGGITATPKMISSIEMLYSEVYGDLIKTSGEFTMADLQADAAFWDAYCNFTPVIRSVEEGQYEVDIYSLGKGDDTITMYPATQMLSTSSIYMTTIYYFTCEKYGVEPYSDEAKGNANVLADFQRIVAGGTSLSYVASNTELIDYFDPSKYLDSGENTITRYDVETLAQHVRTLHEADNASNIVLISAGKSGDSDKYDSLYTAVTTNGGKEVLFLTASNIKDAFANIQCIGLLFGFGDPIVDSVLEDLQKRLYAVYYSLQEKNQTESHKVYWETYAGKAASNSGMSKQIMGFMGWDTSLLGAGEIDLERLLSEEPDIIIFFTNDLRSEEIKMRIAS